MSNWFCKKKQEEIPYKMAKGCRRCRIRKENGWDREWCKHLEYREVSQMYLSLLPVYPNFKVQTFISLKTANEELDKWIEKQKKHYPNRRWEDEARVYKIKRMR